MFNISMGLIRSIYVLLLIKKLDTKLVFFLFFVSIGSSHPAAAVRYWPSQPLTHWTLTLNNGVAYITSSEIPSHCVHSRALIDMSGTEFDRALYAYALSAKARGKILRYVIDGDHVDCIISGLAEQE